MFTFTFILVQLVAVTSAITIDKNPDYITGQHSSVTDEKFAKELYCHINDPDLNFEALQHALKGYNYLKNIKLLSNSFIMTIIDYSKPSDTKRFFVININSRKLLYKSLVAHGKNSGVNYASSFSNKQSSYKSSIGFFITGDTYIGKHGFSLRLNGLEKNINDNARKRAIVIHSASYVTNEHIKKYGRLGRSHGCPALPAYNYENIVDLIKNRTCLFIYYPDSRYLSSSEFINYGGRIPVN